MTSNRYFFIVLLFLYTPLFIKGYANTTKEFSDVIVPEFPLQVKFANEFVDLDRLDMYERFDRELTTLCYMHSSTSLAIKRANRYFPILEPILKEEKVPTDFLYLAVIESTLNPRAVSPAKAVGIWQIMPRTGREYGLEVNNDIDERCCDCRPTTVFFISIFQIFAGCASGLFYMIAFVYIVIYF